MRADQQPELTAQALREGIGLFGLPDSYTLGLARPGEQDVVRRLLALAEVELSTDLDLGVMGDLALKTITTPDDVPGALAAHVSLGGLSRAMAAGTVLLVVRHRDHGEPVAACLMNPPANVLRQMTELGADDQTILLLLPAITKITGLAVHPDHRRTGVGRALLVQAATLAHAAGALTVYGQTRVGDALLGWYQRCGFSVAPPGHGLDLSWLLGTPFGIAAAPGEQLFVSTFDRLH